MADRTRRSRSLPSPGGWWGQRRNRSRTRPALLHAGAPLRSSSAPPICLPGAGPQVPSAPHPSAPAGSGPSVRVRASRARRAGGRGRPGRRTERCHCRVWAEKPPGARGRRGLQPGARVVSESRRQLEFCASGEIAELLALCWEFRVYCGHGVKDPAFTWTGMRRKPPILSFLLASGAFQCAVGSAFVNLMGFRLTAVLVFSRCQGCGDLTHSLKILCRQHFALSAAQSL